MNRSIAFTLILHALIIGGLFSTGFLLADDWHSIDSSPQRGLLYLILFLILPIAVTVAVVHIAIVIRIITMVENQKTIGDSQPGQPSEHQPSEDPEQRNAAGQRPASTYNRRTTEFALLVGAASGVLLSGLFVVFVLSNSDPEAAMALITLPAVFALGSIVGFLTTLLIRIR